MKKRDTQSKRENGQSLVEMALMMTVFVLLLAGVLDLGRMYFTYLALQNAAGEGAAYGSIFPYRHYNPGDSDCQDSVFCAVDVAENPDNVKYRVQHESPSRLVDWTGTTVRVNAPYPQAGSYITVTVTYEYDVLTPVIEIITGDTLTLGARSVHTIVGK